MLAETCAAKSPTPLESMIAMGMNVLASNTFLAGRALLVDSERLAEIPRITVANEDSSEFGVRVPYDVRGCRRSPSSGGVV